MNKVILIGRLGRDPEIKYLDSGKAVAKFSLATQDTKDKCEWHQIVCWEKTAELVAQYLAKGRQCAIEGRIQTRQWEKDGEKRYSTEIVAHRVEFVGSKSDVTKAPAPKQEGATPAYDSATPPSDDLPF